MKKFICIVFSLFFLNCYLNPLLQDQFSGEDSSDNSNILIGAILLSTPNISASITFPQSSYSLSVGGSEKITPTLSGTILSCTVYPSLPDGLSLSSACEITGTPTSSSSETSYLISGIFSEGEANTSLIITITSSGSSTTLFGLSNIEISGYSLSPTFSSDVYEYSVTISGPGEIQLTGTSITSNVTFAYDDTTNNYFNYISSGVPFSYGIGNSTTGQFTIYNNDTGSSLIYNVNITVPR